MIYLRGTIVIFINWFNFFVTNSIDWFHRSINTGYLIYVWELYPHSLRCWVCFESDCSPPLQSRITSVNLHKILAVLMSVFFGAHNHLSGAMHSQMSRSVFKSAQTDNGPDRYNEERPVRAKKFRWRFIKWPQINNKTLFPFWNRSARKGTAAVLHKWQEYSWGPVWPEMIVADRGIKKAIIELLICVAQ